MSFHDQIIVRSYFTVCNKKERSWVRPMSYSPGCELLCYNDVREWGRIQLLNISLYITSVSYNLTLHLQKDPLAASSGGVTTKEQRDWTDGSADASTPPTLHWTLSVLCSLPTKENWTQSMWRVLSWNTKTDTIVHLLLLLTTPTEQTGNVIFLSVHKRILYW